VPPWRNDSRRCTAGKPTHVPPRRLLSLLQDVMAAQVRRRHPELQAPGHVVNTCVLAAARALSLFFFLYFFSFALRSEGLKEQGRG
jgi:hypothetical protein